MSYGWMGRTPDYKASLMNTLGANSAFYDKFAANAKNWHRRAQDHVLFMNHAIVNPPVDRAKAADQVKDVFITIQKETDAGIYVSGAKVVATSSALTHYNFLGQNAAMPINDSDLAVMFIAPMNAPGVKLFCRASYEMMASVMGTPFDYPLSSRFDENDAIFVFDNVLIPWEDVLLHRDIEKIKVFYPRSGFLNGYQFQGCTRLAVKLDFMVGIIAKALRATGADEFRGNQAMLGEVIAWRNLFWAISDAMAMNPVPWVGDTVLPNAQSGASYRVFAGDAYGRIKEIVEKIVASALIYLPSSAKDFENPEIDKYLAKYVRGSHGIGYRERIKIMKLLWDAIGTEFGGRHELYEMNYAGNHEDIRIQAMWNARGSGALDAMIGARRDLHGRLRRERLDRLDLAQSGRCLRPRDGCAGGGVGCCRVQQFAPPGGGGDELDLFHELDRPTARRRHGRRLRGDRAGAGRDRAGAAVSRGDEPARRRRPCGDDRRARRQDRLHRDRGVLGVGCAADAARVPQPAQPHRADPAREQRVLRQHAGRRMRGDRRHLRRPHRRGDGRALPQRGSGRRSRPARRCSLPPWSAFDCRVVEIKAVASHNVIFGAVVDIRIGPPGRRWSITSERISWYNPG